MSKIQHRSRGFAVDGGELFRSNARNTKTRSVHDSVVHMEYVLEQDGEKNILVMKDGRWKEKSYSETATTSCAMWSMIC